MARKKAASASDVSAQELERTPAGKDTPRTEKPAGEPVRADMESPVPTEAARKISLLSAPTGYATPVCTVQAGTHLDLLGEGCGWAMVLFGEVRGWVPADALRR